MAYNINMKKNIAIAGFGVEGRENLRYFYRKFPSAEFWIFDENLRSAKDTENSLKSDNFEFVEQDFSRNISRKAVVFGGDISRFLEPEFSGKFDLILRSPSLAPKKISRQALSPSGEISSATNWFFANCPAKIIGITGSKGKGTSCSFTAEILRKYFAKNGEKNQVFLVGNIGIPALSELEKIHENDAVVYELSSFQLWDLAKSPNFSGATIIEPDHLDVHKDFEEYVAAKSNIFAKQTEEDFAIFNASDQNTREMAERSAGKKISYPDENFANISGENICFADKKIIAKNDLKLPGEHNVRNAMLAVDLAYFFAKNREDFDEKTFMESAAEGLKSFAGLDHRLKFTGEKNGVKFYDDSIATTPGSAIAAIEAFSKNAKILILGGHDKGADYAELGEKIRENGHVKIVVAMGGNSRKIIDEISLKIDSKTTKIIEFSPEKLKGFENPFSEILAEIQPEFMDGDVVILSPAAASFDLFKNYADRGNKFAEAAKSLR